jgi:hypothetical protein
MELYAKSYNESRNHTRYPTVQPFTTHPEKNWGAKAFPSRWWWMQCNTFEGHANLTLTSTGALREIPLVGEEQVALIGVHWKGRFLPFPQVSWDVRWGRWLVRGKYNEWEVEIEGTCGDDDKVRTRVHDNHHHQQPWPRRRVL